MLDLVNKAIGTAKYAHKGQKYGNRPYIHHLATVALFVPYHLQHVAWLHDTLEDTSTTYEDLVKGFGKDTADLVKELTSPKGETEEEKDERLWNLSPDAMLVKAADTKCNVMATLYDIVNRLEYDHVVKCLNRLNKYLGQPQIQKWAHYKEVLSFVNSRREEALAGGRGTVLTLSHFPVFKKPVDTFTPILKKWIYLADIVRFNIQYVR